MGLQQLLPVAAGELLDGWLARCTGFPEPECSPVAPGRAPWTPMEAKDPWERPSPIYRTGRMGWTFIAQSTPESQDLHPRVYRAECVTYNPAVFRRKRATCLYRSAKATLIQRNWRVYMLRIRMIDKVARMAHSTKIFPIRIGARYVFQFLRVLRSGALEDARRLGLQLSRKLTRRFHGGPAVM